jgi:hypothetical protein
MHALVKVKRSNLARRDRQQSQVNPNLRVLQPYLHL